MSAYNQAVHNVKLSGPTIFSQVLATATGLSSAGLDGSSYYTLLVSSCLLFVVVARVLLFFFLSLLYDKILTHAALPFSSLLLSFSPSLLPSLSFFLSPFLSPLLSLSLTHRSLLMVLLLIWKQQKMQ